MRPKGLLLSEGQGKCVESQSLRGLVFGAEVPRRLEQGPPQVRRRAKRQIGTGRCLDWSGPFAPSTRPKNIQRSSRSAMGCMLFSCFELPFFEGTLNDTCSHCAYRNMRSKIAGKSELSSIEWFAFNSWPRMRTTDSGQTSKV